MNYDIEFQIDMEDHFQALNLDDETREIAERTLEDANVLSEENGIKKISIPKYMEYTLSRLEETKNSAFDSRAIKILQNYESVARDFLHDWTNIIGNKCYLMADDYFSPVTKEAAEPLKKLIDDMQTIFEHLSAAHKLLVEFGLANRKSDPARFEIV